VTGASFGAVAGEGGAHAMKGALDITGGHTKARYEQNKTELVKTLATTLSKTNLGGEQIEKMINDLSPSPFDTDEDYKNKLRIMKESIKRSVNTARLKAAKITKD
jgi:hypothetical protein